MEIFTLEHRDDGEVYLDGVSSEVHVRGHWAFFQRKLEKMVGKALKSAVYLWWKRGTKENLGVYTARIVEALRVGDKRVLAEHMLLQLYKRGYGEPKIVVFNEKKIIITIRNSFNAVGYKKTKHCVCYALCGMLAGGSEMIFGDSRKCEEVKCIARGDGICEFEIVPSKAEDK